MFAHETQTITQFWLLKAFSDGLLHAGSMAVISILQVRELRLRERRHQANPQGRRMTGAQRGSPGSKDDALSLITATSSA